MISHGTSQKIMVGLCYGLLGLLMLSDPIAPPQNPQGRLEVRILNGETGQPTPVRVHLVDARGSAAPLPEAAVAIMYGMWDHADGYGYQPDNSFYVDGAFEVELQPGTYSLTLSKGNEYLAQQHEVIIEADTTTEHTYHLERWIDMPRRGWYSADDHIHIRRSPREDPLIIDWVQAEDIHVGVLLQMGDFWDIYYSQYAWGSKGVYQEEDYLLASGQEDPRTPELGHALGIGAADSVRYRDEYYDYDKVFDRIHELGGVTGYAHQATIFHGYRGLTLDGLRGKVDVLELLQFCAPQGPLFVDHYYHLLDLGYEVTAVAGSDFPWCGMDHRYGLEVDFDKAARIGNVRFYTYTGDALTYDRWKAALEAGHTFVTSGPVVDLRVNDRLPGDRLDVEQGSPLKITARAYGHERQVPLETLEIIGHGKVLSRVTAAQSRQSTEYLMLEMELPAEHGIWLAAKTTAGPFQIAHTTPIYVTVDGGGFHNRETASRYLDLNEKYLQELEHELAHPGEALDHQAWRYKEGLQARIAETRRVIEKLRKKR
jgi:hypothetical protein